MGPSPPRGHGCRAGRARPGLVHIAKLDLLAGIMQPVLVANGDNDRMVPMRNSHQLAERLPHGRLRIDADAGRGFLFQHPQDVAAEVQSFLA